MERRGPEPNIYTYNTVTRAYAEAGRLEEAVGVLRDIKVSDNMPCSERLSYFTHIRRGA